MHRLWPLWSVWFALVVLLSATSLNAQRLVLRDTNYCAVGQSLVIPGNLVHSSGSVQHLQAQLYLSNPTVFFPQTLMLNSIRIDSALRRLNDSMYAIDCSIPAIDSIPLTVIGECLAGNSSHCQLHLSDITLDTVALANVESFVVLQFDSSHAGSYVRFAAMSEAFPQPSYDGSSLHWQIRLDLASNVSCTIYDAVGRALAIYEFDAGIGLTDFQFVPSANYYPGSYTLRMECSTGELVRRFVIIR